MNNTFFLEELISARPPGAMEGSAGFSIAHFQRQAGGPLEFDAES
jgi:hypothetical protein